jgi:general nucleoside transport system ATP-binding protein
LHKDSQRVYGNVEVALHARHAAVELLDGGKPSALIIGQPILGVDIGAIEFIYRQIIEVRASGKAILLVSVGLDEIRALSDRVLVLFAGRVVGEQTPDASEQTVGLMMAGIAA